MKPTACDVVLVETEPGIARALASALERRGHRVRHAAGTEEALALPDPDVLVAVLGAPGGLELLAEARRRGRLAHAVLLARDAPAASLGRARDLGVIDVLPRPVELPELIRAVESAAVPRETEFSFSLPAEHRSVAEVARRLLAFAVERGVGPTARARLASATTELVDNAVRHAYPSRAGEIEVAARLSEREASIRVRDRGIGFEIEDGPDGRRPVQFPADTGGVERARAFSEDLQLWSEPGRGCTALMRFGIYRVDFEDGPRLDLSEHDYFAPHTAREVLGELRADPEGADILLSPALAVLVGRLLSIPSQAPPRDGLSSP